MINDKQTGLLFEAWTDLDRVTDGLDTPTATRLLDGGSSIAWVTAHVTAHLDTWVNVRFAGLSPHPVINDGRFRLNGGGILESEWQLIQSSVKEVRESVRHYLDASPAMDSLVPYSGYIELLRESGITLRYTILRMSAHDYFHIGEISTKRAVSVTPWAITRGACLNPSDLTSLLPGTRPTMGPAAAAARRIGRAMLTLSFGTNPDLLGQEPSTIAVMASATVDVL